jgi:hypothetical protein
MNWYYERACGFNLFMYERLLLLSLLSILFYLKNVTNYERINKDSISNAVHVSVLSSTDVTVNRRSRTF